MNMYFSKNDQIKPLGAGYTIIEYGDENLKSPENVKLIDDLVTNAKNIRGEIISQALDIEYYVDKILEIYFFHDDQEKIDAFNKYILQEEFFSFGNKLKALRSILTDNPDLFHIKSNEVRKDIITYIREVMETRNKFAHTEIVVNYKEKKTYIYGNDGENLLSQEFLKNFFKKTKFLSINYVVLYTNFVIEITKKAKIE